MASPTAKKSEPAAEAPTPKPVVNKASLPAARSNPQTAAAAPPAEVQKGNDSFVLRLAAQRSSAESKSLAERIRREYAAEIGNRGYRIDETTFGSEKFYVADVGPFGELDTARALCASIRNNGVDCHVVNR